MSVHFNHAAVAATDKHRSATFLTDLLGLAAPTPRCGCPEINTNHGGRGIYFDDPAGHHFESITRPYGSEA